MSQSWSIPDFSSEPGCPHAHELLWPAGGVEGGVATVVAGIMRCPHNPSKNSPWCIHSTYHGIALFQIREYLITLGVSQDTLHEYCTSTFLAGLLDTTRRAPIKGSVDPGEDGFHFCSDNSALLNLEYGVGLQHLHHTEERLVRSLLTQTRTMITGIPASKDCTHDFILNYWDPVRHENTKRQNRVKIAILSLESQRRSEKESRFS